MKLMETIQTSFDHLIRENPMGEARKDRLLGGFSGTVREGDFVEIVSRKSS